MADQREMGTMNEMILNSDLDRLKQGLQEQRWTESDMVESALLAAKQGVWDCLSVLLDHGFPVDRYTAALVLCFSILYSETSFETPLQRPTTYLESL